MAQVEISGMDTYIKHFNSHIVESTWEYGYYPGSHVQIDSSYINIGKVFRSESRPLEMKWNTEKVGR